MQLCFDFWKNSKIHRREVRAIGWMLERLESQEADFQLRLLCTVAGGIVMVKNKMVEVDPGALLPYSLDEIPP